MSKYKQSIYHDFEFTNAWPLQNLSKQAFPFHAREVTGSMNSGKEISQDHDACCGNAY